MRFLGLDIWEGKYQEFLATLEHPHGPHLVFTPNPEMLLRASDDPEYLEILGKADSLVPDGHGLYVASLMREGYSFFSACIRVLRTKKSLSKKYGELIRGSDITKDLLAFAEKEHKKILMIDSYRITEPKSDFEKRKKEIQSHARDIMKEQYPTLSFQIFFHGEMSPDAIAHHIEIAHIDYVFACSGMKSQEQLLFDIFSYLPDHMPIVGIGVGSAFDYILGLQKRAPVIFRTLGLEWLYRLSLDPLGRWHRIVDAVWRFPRAMR